MKCWNCGAKLTVPKDRSLWDVTTKIIKGKEMVVERHVSITCSSCGMTGHPYLPGGNDQTAQAGRDAVQKHFPGTQSEEVGNTVREVVDPPEPFVVVP